MKNTMKYTFAGFGLCAVLFLAACTSSASQPGSQSSLEDSMWSLSTIMEKNLVPGSTITVQFTADGNVSGSAGCNRYSGTYKASGSSIQITSPIASTMMACEQELMDQEQAYLTALSEIKQHPVGDDFRR
jgi:putative lipoprotein